MRLTIKERIVRVWGSERAWWAALLVLGCIASYGLGLRAQLPPVADKPSVIVQQPVAVESDADAAPAVVVVASKNGTRYHLPECPGAGTINPENVIQFNSIELAEAAGYTAAANCPGL
jgi:hypothetical protein